MQPTTVKDFLDFWPRIATQGLIAKPAAANYRNAASAIFSATSTSIDSDVKTIDLDKLLRKFENLTAKKYKPATMGVLESRFKRAREEFLRWAENPKTYEPQIGQARPRANSASDKNDAKSKNRGEKVTRREESNASDDDDFQPSDDSMIVYPFPLRPGVVAKLLLPTDLTSSDVNRIAAFLKSAVLPGDGGGL